MAMASSAHEGGAGTEAGYRGAEGEGTLLGRWGKAASRSKRAAEQTEIDWRLI
jgi:hypothetical protein